MRKSMMFLSFLAAMLLGTTSLRAQCDNYATLPYSTGFEGIPTDGLPSCWMQVQTGTNNGHTFPSVYEHSPNTRNGNCYFEFEASSGSSNMEVVALPMMQNISSLKLTMWISSSSSYPCALEVGVLEDDSVFVSVESLSLITFSGSNGWKQNYHEYTVFFDSYTGSGERIAIRAVRLGTGQYTLFIDDLTVTEFNGCYPVENLHLVDADSSEIALAWVDTMNSGASYTVTYWKNGGDTVVDYVYDTFYTASSLDASSGYNFIVTPNCSSGDGEPASGTFRTTCGMLMVPFMESFESADALECWSRISCAGNTGYVSGNQHSGAGCFRFTYNSNPPQYLVSPKLGGTDDDGILVSFWYKKYSASYVENFKVGYSTTTSDPSSFAWGNEVIPTTSYQEFTGVYPAGTKYVAIQYMQNNGYYLYIDDFQVGIDNGCNKPNDAYVDSVGPYTAYLHWTSGGAAATGYNLYYGTQNNLSAATAITGISDTSYTLTGLLPQTTYYAWVRTDCSGDSSDAKAFASFTTDLTCAPLTSVTIDDISYTAASISWGYNASVGFSSNGVVITLVDNTDTNAAPLTVTTTGTSYVFTGLVSGHAYTAVLRNVCDAEGQTDTAASNTVSFMTSSCSEISSDGSTNQYIPTYTYYNYSYSQAIYTHDQMANVDTIHGLAFNVTGNTVAGNARTLDVYMGHTTQSTFSGSSSWVPLADMTLVASGVLVDASSTGWKVINFTTDFIYDGSSNLVIAVDDNTGSYKSSPNWASIAASGQGISVYSDGTNYDPASPASGTVRNSIPAVRFIADCEVPTCFAPMVVVDAVDSVSISVHWNIVGVENSWAVGIKAAGDAGFTYNPTAVTDTFYTFTGLNSNTQYTIVIGSLCVDTLKTTMTVRTNCGQMALPFFEDWETIPNNGAWPACWDSTMHHNTDPSVNWEYNHTPGGQFSMFLMASGDYNLVVSPSVPLPGDQINIDFWARQASGSYTWMKVGVITNPHDTSTFIPLLEIPDHDNQFHEYEVNTVGLDPTATYHVAWLFYSTSTSYRGAIDDIAIEQVSSCPRPAQPVVTGVTSDQISLAFGGSVSGDYKLYITSGASFTDSASVSGDSTYTFTGLNPVTTYTITLHADCGTELSNPRTVSATTTMVADSLPLSTGFEVGQDTSWLLVNGSETNKWYIGSAVNNGGGRALYISSDNGATNSYSNTSTSNVYATKLLNFDAAGDYAVSYDWRANGESSYDYLRVLLAPGTVEPAAGNTMGIGTSGAPSGWTALDGGSKLNLVSTWQNHNEVINISAPGNYMLVFFWHNDNSQGTAPAAAIDNVQLNILSCPSPQNIVVDNITGTSATVHWTPVGSENEWEVVVGNTVTTVSTPSITVSNLEALMNYNVSVRAVCGAGDTSFAATGSFTTDMCDNMVSAENWDSTMSAGTSTYGPIGYSLYNYSYVQTIIDSSYMATLDGMDITAMSFNVGTFNQSSSTMFNNMSVYMANVSETSLSSDFIHPDASHVFTKVIVNASFNYTESGWQVHGFDSSFVWDGHSNVLVAVKRDNGSYSGSQSFVAHTATGDKMRYVYQDSGPYNINTVSGGYTSNTVGNIRLISCGAGCSTPTAVVSNITAQSAKVVAHGNGSLFEFEYGTDNAALGNTMTSTTGVFNISGLQPETQYFFAVRQQCDSALFSNWSTGSFTTDELGCLAPTNFAALSTDYTAATFGWTAGNEETAWEVHVFNLTFDTVIPASATTLTVNGLDNNVTFYAAVRALCGTDATIEGPWGDTISFSTDSCHAVTNVQTNVTSTMAIITWTGTSASYRLAYMEPPFNMVDATQVTVNTNSYTITGLYAETQYVFVIVNNCAEGVNTATGMQSFTTLASGVEPTYYAITVVSNNPEWGTVTGGGNYQENATVTLTATANEGYHFEQWNDGVTTATRTITVTGDATYTAFFAEDGTVTTYYTVTVTSNNAAWGTVSGGGQYAEGSTATITATPASGYRFVEWNDGNTQNPRSFTVTADVAYVATFEATEGIGDVMMGTVSLYPNPASTSVTLGLEGFEGEVNVEIVDMNGRVVTHAITHSSNQTITFDVNDMPQGAYFVRVVSGTRTAVSKLMVK